MGVCCCDGLRILAGGRRPLSHTSLGSLHIMRERLCSKKPTFRREGFPECAHTHLKPHSTSVHIEIRINGLQRIKEKSAFGQNNLCLKPVPDAIWPKQQRRSGQTSLMATLGKGAPSPCAGSLREYLPGVRGSMAAAREQMIVSFHWSILS